MTLNKLFLNALVVMVLAGCFTAVIYFIANSMKPADVVCAQQITKTSEFCKAWVEHLKLQDSTKGK